MDMPIIRCMTCQEILHNYVFNHSKPPTLYIAILANDLHGTSEIISSESEQQEWNIKDLLKTVHLVHRFVPDEARGSLLKIEQWISKPI
jgi:hypothetical protein